MKKCLSMVISLLFCLCLLTGCQIDISDPNNPGKVINKEPVSILGCRWHYIIIMILILVLVL